MRYKSAPGRIFSAQADMLSREELIRIVRLYQDFGTTKITFCGGEALLRLEDIYAILEAASPVTDFWIDTTGFSLTDDKARKLKMLGLTGLSIRLNHYNASSCNNFRDHPEAFDWVVRAAVAAHRAELVSSLTFYALPSFTNVHDLEQYFNLARKLGVAFVEIMEPDSRKEEASLSEEQRELLQTASLLYNSDPAYADYPIIIYRPCRTGENGTEDNRPRDIHIDAAGGIHTRRFDEKNIGHIDDFPPDLSLQLVEAWKGA